MTAGQRPVQRGVAIITALVVVAAATIAVSAMMWRQAIAVRKVENQSALGEGRWIARSAIEWARLILLQDARTSSVDHLGELWALPLAETRVTDDLGTGPSAPVERGGADDASAAFVSGRITDAQARMNLTGLMVGKQVDDARLAMLVRLLALFSVKKEVAESIAVRMGDTPRPDSYRQLADGLVADRLIDASMAERLRPFLTVLPVPTPVNLNTAPAEVLAACYQDLPIDAAQALVRSRQQAWFNQVSDATGRLPGTSGQLTAAAPVSVDSHFFNVEGSVRVGRAELEVAALLEREAGGATRVRSFTER